LRPLEDQNQQMPDRAGTSFTNIIYTILPTFPSRKIFRLEVGKYS